MGYDPNEPRDSQGRWDVHGNLKGVPRRDQFMRSPWEYDKKSLSGLGVKASLSEPLTKEEIAAIKDWSGMGFDGLNQALRGQFGLVFGSYDYSNRLAEKAFPIDSAMRKATLDQPVQVYRSMDGTFANKIPINTKYKDLGFAATTEVESIAHKFGWHDPVIFKIDIPKGFRAMPIRAISHSPYQEEILINRGTTFIRTGKNQLKILA